MPTRKVGSGALAGSIVTLIVGALGMNAIEIDAEMSAAAVVLVTFIVQWFVTDAPAES